MKRKLLLGAFMAFYLGLSAQNPQFFKEVSESSLQTKSSVARTLKPSAYKVFSLNLEGLTNDVKSVGNRINSRLSQKIVTFPNDKGNSESFAIYDSEVMHPELQAKYPQIRSYFGVSKENPLNKVYFTITPQGLRGIIKGEKTIYIDPYKKGDSKNYIIYDRSNLSRDLTEDWRCYADDLVSEAVDSKTITTDNKNFKDGILRRYEIAIACTSEYTAYHDDGNNANGDARADALAAIVVTVARVNTVYEQDLAMTFQLVPRNDELIYFNEVSVGPNANADPYDNYSGGQMLDENTNNINELIDSANYDIGHVFSTGGGGIAGTSPCDDGGGKGRGVTGIVTPEFDPFDIDYVSHEIGHQFSAGHTYYNACFGSKVGEDYEPGSASTIMGYAGICFPNVQENSDAYFHATSIARITNSAGADGCFEAITISNIEPTAVAGANYTIPISTSFILDATGTSDPDGDPLTYCWEQFDNDGTFPQPPQSTNGGGPVFRTLFPTIDPTRTFPNLEAVINNETPTWEVLPSVQRTMNFRLTVRDNNPLGGQTDQDNMVVSVAGTRGPFLVSYPNAASTTWFAGNTETVTWDVNNTAALSANVNILLSTDGGYTYPVTLASNVTNDGSQDITVPLEVGTSNRIKIEAASNIFFDLSNQDFEIKAGTWEFASGSPIQNVCQGGTASYSINFTPAVGYSENVTFSASGNPAGTSVSFSPTSSNSARLVTMTVTNTAGVPIGSYPITVTGTSSPSNDIETIATTLNVYNNTIGDVVQATPANGAINQSTATQFTWNQLTTAASYTIQIADSRDFTNIVEAATVVNVNSYRASNLNPGVIYHWRVRPSNPCVIGNFNTVFSFQTADNVCVTYDNEYFENNDSTWEATGANAVSARVDIPDNIIIDDVNFYMRATHGNINHIKMQFSSPQGRFAEIYNRDCSGSNFDVTFSDAGIPLTCGDVDPATNAGLEGIQQASQLFTRFHGESAQGTWVLLATDRTFGTGGSFQEFNVSVCGELQKTTEIVIVENNILTTNIGQTQTITNGLLRVSQSGASNNQLVYTINEAPTSGTISLSGTPLTTGQTFTQRSINLGNLTYTNNGTTGGNDNFTFTVNGINGDELDGQIFNILAPQVSEAPVASCQDIIIDLGASGVITILPSAIDNGSTDDIAITNYSIDKDTFTCDDLGTPQIVTLTVTDGEGQAASCTATVTLTHNTPPANLTVSGITDTQANVTWNDAGADSYDVRFRESGTTPWTIITGIASNSTVLSGLTSETQYDVEVRAECNGDFTPFTTTVQFTTLETPINYCDSFGTRTQFEWIESVILEDISNISGDNGGYEDFTANLFSGFTTNLVRGDTPELSLDKGFNGGPYTESVSVWIDYNKNGVFTDSGEQVIRLAANTADVTNEPFINAIPASANLGNTRMRVAMRYFNNTTSFNDDPCAQFGDGEVEDYTVTIISAGDTTNPTITCNPDRTVEGCDGETVTLATPATSDDVAVDTVTNDAPATFNLGNTIVTWTVTDTSGNTATCEQTVTVQDTTDPMIACPADITTDTDSGMDTAVVNYTAPVGTDNCTATTTQTAGLASGSTFPIGITTNTFTVTDGSGNTTSCSFTVTVNDADAPDITCPADVSAFTDTTGCQASSVTLGTATSTDASATITNDAPATFPLGDTTVTWTATDSAMNSSTCTQTVTVTDNVDPMIACAADVVVEGCDAETVTLTAPTTNDNCGVTSVTNDAPATFNFGDTIVTWTVTDTSGNTATCQQTVTVQDTTDPMIACPADITTDTDSGMDTAVVNYSAPVGTDNCTATTTQTAGLASGSTFPIGITTNTFTVTDGSGNTTSCSFTVTVNDADAPDITCPADVSAFTDTTGCQASSVTLGTATSTDASATITNDAPATFPLGDTTVTWTATDTSGNSNTCIQTVTVTDNVDPTITCAADVVVEGCDAETVTLTAPTTNDNCGVTSVTNDAPATFNFGDTIVTWTVTDTSGNTATCEQTVTVQDTTDPMIDCPADITTDTDSGMDTAVVNYSAPVGTDNCTATTTQTAGLPSGSTFPIGITTNTFTVTDGSGNTTSCSFTVTVNDKDAPDITCPADVSAFTDTTGCQASSVTLGTATSTDASATITNDAPATFPLGDTTVTWTATDTSGNSNTCIQTVTVTDNVDPMIACPADITTDTDSGMDTAVVNYTAPVGTDNCTATTTQTAGLASGSTFPIGITTNTFTVTDGSGNTTSCSFTVTVNDADAPDITCPADVSAFTDTTGCQASSVTLGTATSTDTSATITNDAPATFPLGDTTVTWTATDTSGNSNTCIQTVTVTDNVDPMIACPADITTDTDSGMDTAVVNYSAPVGTDNCTATTTQTAGLASGSTFPIGITTNTFTVTDGSGNTTSCSFTVTVNDADAPDITCPADVSAFTDTTGCQASSVTLGTATSTDTSATITNDAPATFPLGDTTVTWTATDTSGNSNTCIQTVTVTDNVDPMIACPADITTDTDSGMDTAVVNYTAPVGTDNCTATTTQTAGLASGSTFPIGITTNTFTVTDGSGNTTSCSFTVTVNDADAPDITCPADVSAFTDTTGCQASSVTLGTATSTDASATITNDAPATFPLGDTTVTWTATDTSGNSNTCIQTVTVTDNVDPMIACPADITTDTDSGMDTAVVNYTAPVGTDNCTATTTQTAGLASGSTFPIGITTNTFTVTDGSGNTTSCSFTVTVNDADAPDITCPADVSAFTDTTGCQASSVTLGTATSTDASATITNDAPATFPLGDTTVTWTATDTSGNSNTCIQTVTVTDNVDPMIACPADITTDTDSGMDTAVVNYTAPVGTDNCTATTTQTAGLASGSTFPIGITTNTFTVTDGSGNTTSCSFTVTVNDADAPDITCPADVSAFTDTTGCQASSVTLGTATSTDASATITNDAPATFPLGDTIVTWTVTDTSGNSNTCIQTVTVTDNVDPTITCAADVVVEGCDAETVTLTAPTTNDNCGVTSVTNDAPATFPLGDTIVTWTVTDTSGNTATCQQTVTVQDTTDPMIACPADITTDTDSGMDTAVVNYTAPVGTDNCTATTTQTAGLPSGSTFPIGITTNTFTVTDGSGNTTSCSFTVTVNDADAPDITCPADVSAFTDTTGCQASSVTLGTATSTDASATITNDAPATFPLGDTTVTWTATDTSGNSNTCIQTVTVTDNVDPTITCAADVIVEGCDAETVTLTAPTTNDNCGVTSVTNDAPATFPLGDTIVTWTVTDTSGNTATCEQTVTVQDTTDPMIACPADITTDTDSGMDTAVVNYTAPVGTDNCTATTAQTAGLASGSTFPIGITTNTFTVTDGSGNTTSCSFTVTVNDADAPDITCPADVSAFTDTTGCQASSVTLGTAMSTDASATITNDAPATFPLGDTIVTWTVTDTSGNTATCEQTVTVQDTTDPTITCEADVVVEGCDAETVTLTAPTTNDNCGVTSVTNDAPATFNFGDTIVTWTVTDTSGNTATCQQTVTVQDTTDPMIACPADITTDTDSGMDTAVVNYTAPVGTDNCTATTTQTAGLASGSTFPIGITTNTFTVTDGSGNTTSCSFTVTVNDADAPDITCPADVSAFTDTTGCQASSVTLGTATSTDASATITNDAPATFPLGDTTVTWTATDTSGNSNTCIQTITIRDITPPELNCPVDYSVDPNDENIYLLEDFTDLVTDNCTPSDQMTITQMPAPGTVFEAGTITMVTLSTQDASGNTALCSFELVVTDQLGIDSSSLGKINIYPVPTKGQLTITSAQRTLQSAQLFDMRGRLVKTVQLSNTANTFSIDDLSDAVYLIRIQFQEGTILKRIIKSADQ